MITYLFVYAVAPVLGAVAVLLSLALAVCFTLVTGESDSTSQAQDTSSE